MAESERHGFVRSKTRQAVGVLVVVTLTAFGWFAGGAVSSSSSDTAGAPELITALAAAELAGPGDEPTVARSQLVAIDPAALAGAGEDGPETGPTRISISPFGQTMTAQRTGLEELSAGGYLWSGRVVGQVGSSVLMVVRDGMVTGEIRSLSGIYEIRQSDSGQLLVELDDSAFPESPDQPDSIDPPDTIELDAAVAAASEIGADTGERIDVLVVYTPEARVGAGGQAAMESLIDLAIAQTNQALATAGVPTVSRLVHTAEVTGYVEGTSLFTGLPALRNANDGVIDEAIVLQNQYGADLVHLLVEDGAGFCGIGYILGGYSITARGCATGNLTFAHEQGHNMGVRHDWYVDDSGTYNHGYLSNAGGFRTIMAYNSGCTVGFCSRVVTFSSPDVTVDGLPAGVPIGTDLSCVEGNLNPQCDADNGQAITDNLSIVANFRQEVSQVERVTGAVNLQTGAPVEGAKLNLFSEGRAEFLGVAFTGADGTYEFDLPSAGCYVVTFIGEPGDVWAATSTRYKNTPFCAATNETVSGIDGVLIPSSALGTLTGTIDGPSGPTAGVKAVLFEANADGSRGQWIAPAFTGADGAYQFAVQPGCYVLDLVAPEGLLWTTTAGQFKRVAACVSAGETVSGLEDSLYAPGSGALLRGQVIDTGESPVAGVRTVLYAQNTDGSRGQWLGPAFTSADGVFSFDVGAGCYVVDMVAQAGTTWLATGSSFKRYSPCVEAGETVGDLDGVLVAPSAG